jgi:NodT family efflux transporter outer membrane factor (OMF) lipoprotein
VDLGSWWRGFGDPTLDDLAQRLLASNLDLEAAAARVRQARALARIAGAARYPEVDYNLGVTRARSRFYGASGPSVTGDAFSAQATVAWEADLFGRLAKTTRAAEEDAQAALEDQRSVRVSLLADLVGAYLDLRGVDRRLGLARENLAAQRETERVSSARFRVGEESGVDHDRAAAQASATAAQIPALEADRSVLVHRLAVLLGQSPATLDAELARTRPLPTLTLPVDAGIPADLLRNRPDVRAGERRVAAAWQRLGAAQADLLPRLTLAGSIGALAPALDNPGNAFVWSIATGLGGPIYDGGRRRAAVDLQRAGRDEAIAQYRQAVLIGAREVEDALIRYEREARRNAELSLAARQYAGAAVRVRQAWKAGEAPFLDVLDADRSRLSAEDSQALSDIALADDIVEIHRALGAGWADAETDALSPSTASRSVKQTPHPLSG